MKHALFPFSVRSASARTAAARSAFIRYIRACASVLLSAALISCRPVPDAGGDTEITLVTYNAQTFFDSVTEGSEFREFRKADWNEGLYRTRLERLAGTLSAAAAIPDTEEKPAASGLTEFLQSLRRFAAAGRKLPDIAVLQEIENEEVLRDLTAFLPVPDFYLHRHSVGFSGRFMHHSQHTGQKRRFPAPCGGSPAGNRQRAARPVCRPLEIQKRE